MIQRCRQIQGYRPMPILFNEDDVNEDDHYDYDFERPDSHILSAISVHASWGLLDQGKNDYTNGYQCPPINWSINTERKRAFFSALRQISGA